MALTEYDAVAADLGSIHCLVCDMRGTSTNLRKNGCTHAPEVRERRTPVTADPQPGDVMVEYGNVPYAYACYGYLTIVMAPGAPLGDLANTLAAAGPIEGDVFTERDAELVREAIPRLGVRA